MDAYGITDDPTLPTWTYATGQFEDLERLRRSLGLYELDPVLDADRTQHASILTFGNDLTNRWAALPVGSTFQDINTTILRIAGNTPRQRYRDVVALNQATEANLRVDASTSNSGGATPTNLPPEFDTPHDPDMYRFSFSLTGGHYGVVGDGGDIATLRATDPNAGDKLTFSAVGKIPLPYEITSSGTLRVIPGTRAVGGTFTFQVQVSDDATPPLSDVATVTLRVTGAGIGKCTAVDDSYTVKGHAESPCTYEFRVRQNDRDANPTDGPFNHLRISRFTVPAHGTLNVDDNADSKKFFYTPHPGYTGTDTFLYEALEIATHGRNWARVSITVAPHVAPNELQPLQARSTQVSR